MNKDAYKNMNMEKYLKKVTRSETRYFSLFIPLPTIEPINSDHYIISPPPKNKIFPDFRATFPFQNFLKL